MQTAAIIRQYQEHTRNVGDLHIKRIGNNMADVFSGEGFPAPTRYRLIKGTWTYVTGPKLDVSAQQLKDALV
jgi:preprotein translocase subunit SecD